MNVDIVSKGAYLELRGLAEKHQVEVMAKYKGIEVRLEEYGVTGDIEKCSKMDG